MKKLWWVIPVLITLLFLSGILRAGLKDLDDGKTAGVDSLTAAEWNALLNWAQDSSAWLFSLADTIAANEAGDVDTSGTKIAAALADRAELASIRGEISDSVATHDNFSELAGTVGDAQIADGAVDGGTGGEIADGSITAADLAANSVDSDELVDGAVDTSHINDTEFVAYIQNNQSSTSLDSSYETLTTDSLFALNDTIYVASPMKIKSTASLSINSLDPDALDLALSSDGTLNAGTDSIIYFEAATGNVAKALFPSTTGMSADDVRDSTIAVMDDSVSRYTTDANIPNDITIDYAGDADTTGTELAAALGARVENGELASLETDPDFLADVGDSADVAIQNFKVTLLAASLDSSVIKTADTLFIGYATSAMTVDTVVVHCTEPTPNFSYQIYHGKGAPGDNTAMFASGQAVTAINFTRDATFSDATIEKGAAIHIVFTAMTTAPKNLGVAFVGERQ